ncbi:MAG: MBL fold metallo-hydrolase [Candidatus Lokiarchaeota archaeon]|nr:MBL fold metallo-hydrolase [Candidatus Lokiarchaeota archaeon]
MELEIYGGINEIGGNKVFINVEDKKFLFDFGLSFNDSNQYFSEFLNPRKFNGIIDYLYLNLIPPINRIYRNDLIKPFKKKLSQPKYKIDISETNLIDAFFLTHAHMDHYKFAGFLKKETPIYLNWISYDLIQYLSETSLDPLIPEILNFYESFKVVPKKRQKKDAEPEFKRATKNDFNENEIKRRVNIMENEKPYTFNTSKGEINITQYAVDHSIPGACSYIIEHEGQSLIYTGDFRKHGFHKEWVDHFIDIAKKSNPITIITEGTRVPSVKDFENGLYKIDEQTEKDVEIRSRDLMRMHPGLILVNFPMRNLDRILLYYRLAKKTNRIFAISPKMYLLIDKYRVSLDKKEENVINDFYKAYEIPEFNDPNFKVYLRRKGWGKFESQDYRTHEKQIFDEIDYLTYKDVRKEPEKYLLYLDFFMLSELIDLDLEPDSIMYINSTTDPFNEEMELKEEKLTAWLEHFGILKTETIHSSGHCAVDDLIDTLNKINAENIIPIHTENPKTFEQLGLNGNIIIPQKGKKYQF